MSILYIVGTPIGNLEDISLRALRILGEVDFILCEDTRVTKKLLNHYNVKTPTISFHEHSDEKKIREVLDFLAAGKNLAFVTDAGTPGISDPGGKLIERALEEFGDDVRIESVPGPSAVTAALSISGIPTDKFVFMGFPPHKKGRQTFLRKILESEWPVAVYESKYRIIKFLSELWEVSEKIKKKKVDEIESQISNCQFQISKQFSKSKFQKIKKDENKISEKISTIVVCRELSKMYETVYRGSLESIIKKIKEDKNAQKGEFTVIVGK